MVQPCSSHNELNVYLFIIAALYLPFSILSGEYRTAVEVSRGSAGTSHSKVYGMGNVYSGETTFALFVVWRHGASVTGWVGRYIVSC